MTCRASLKTFPAQRMARRRHVPAAYWQCWSLFLSAYLVGWGPTTTLMVHATLIVGNYSFESIPGLFGWPWQARDYKAHLQYLPDNPYLCDYPNVTKANNSSHLIIPSDGLPVALLAKRGICSFGQKANVALAYNRNVNKNALKDQVVQFCIVFDDEPRTHLIAMQTALYEEMSIRMHLLFVSLVTGIRLRATIQDLSNDVVKAGGLLVTMNPEAPLTPYYNENQQWLVAVMAGFFAFVSCFGCLLVAVHAGLIPAEGRIIITTGGGQIRIDGRQLMTEEQVLQLTRVHYYRNQQQPQQQSSSSPGDDGSTVETPQLQHPPQQEHQTSCSICLEDFHDGDNLTELPCTHRFHQDCIGPWLTQRHPTCPLCKFDMVGHFKANSELATAAAVSLDTNNSSSSSSRGGGGGGGRGMQVLNRVVRLGWIPVSIHDTTEPNAPFDEHDESTHLPVDNDEHDSTERTLSANNGLD